MKVREVFEGDQSAFAAQRSPSDPQAEFQELIQSAGSAFDPSRWMVAYQNQEPIRVVLPQRYPDRPTEGSIFYMGVRPAF